LFFCKKLFAPSHIVAVMLFLSAVLLFVYGQIFWKFSAEIQSNCNLAGPISYLNGGINWIHQWTDSGLSTERQIVVTAYPLGLFLMESSMV
jgi:hypothetical protein